MAEKKQDTRLEAEGAEFLVCAHLLIEAIPTYKSYTQMPGYDLVAVNPVKNSSAKIQVKSRYALNSQKAFMLKNTNADFVVLVMLNRVKASDSQKTKKQNPDIFVFPMSKVLTFKRYDGWHKLVIGQKDEYEDYREAWHLIREFLLQPEHPTP